MLGRRGPSITEGEVVMPGRRGPSITEGEVVMPGWRGPSITEGEVVMPGRRRPGWGTGWRTGWRWVPVLTVSLLLVGSCAQIPTSGAVDRGAPVQGTEDDPQVRVLPRGPVAGQSPQEVVSGFLDASASFEDDHGVARRFLTPRASEQWNPDAGVTVLDDFPRPQYVVKGNRVRVLAEQTALISADGAFMPRAGVEVERTFTVRPEGDSWRIAALPQGLTLDRLDVSLAFRSFDTYFTNPSGSRLVADPVYLPVTGSGSATSLVQAMLDGPTRWLRPAVASAIPPGTRLVVDSVPIANGIAQVDLSAELLEAPPEELERAAAQLTSTLLELSPTVTGVSVSVEGSALQLPSEPAVFTSDTWDEFDPETLTPALGALFVRDGVVRRIDGDLRPVVQGALGTGAFDVQSPSQSWSGGIVTALDPAATELLVTRPFLSQKIVSRRSGRELLPATIDGDDRVWSLDVGGANPTLQVWTGGEWRAASIQAPEGLIRSFRVSVDGTRMAMVLRREVGRQIRSELMVGRVVARGGGLRVEAFRRIERSITRVRHASWVDDSTLVVVGSTSESTIQPTLLNINRTVSELPSDLLVSATSVVGAPGLPLLAGTPGGEIYAAAPAAWRRLAFGRDPAYPG